MLEQHSNGKSQFLSSIQGLELLLQSATLNNDIVHNVKRADFNVMSLMQLVELADNTPDRRQLFGNFLLEDSLTLLIGERGSSKTYLALQLALAVASGAESFLGESVGLHGPVWYINFELSDVRLAKRMKHLTVRGLPFGNNELPKFSATSIRQRLDDVMLKEISMLIDRIEPVLIVIDNFRAAFSGLRADDNSAVASAMLRLCDLKDTYHSSILMLHHTRKGTADLRSTSDLQSGAGALSDFADADFFIRKSKKNRHQRILQRGKSRDVDESDTAKLIEYFPESGSLWFKCIEDGVDEREHIGEDVQRQYSRSNSISWKVIFSSDRELTRSQLLKRLEITYQIKGGSGDRALEVGRSSGKIVRSARGQYKLYSTVNEEDTESLELGQETPNAIYD